MVQLKFERSFWRIAQRGLPVLEQGHGEIGTTGLHGRGKCSDREQHPCDSGKRGVPGVHHMDFQSFALRFGHRAQPMCIRCPARSHARSSGIR